MVRKSFKEIILIGEAFNEVTLVKEVSKEITLIREASKESNPRLLEYEALYFKLPKKLPRLIILIYIEVEAEEILSLNSISLIV